MPLHSTPIFDLRNRARPRDLTSRRDRFLFSFQVHPARNVAALRAIVNGDHEERPLRVAKSVNCKMKARRKSAAAIDDHTLALHEMRRHEGRMHTPSHSL